MYSDLQAQLRKEYKKKKLTQAKERKQARQLELDPFAHLSDKVPLRLCLSLSQPQVKFGETIEAPPNINSLPRRATKAGFVKPKVLLCVCS